MKKIKKIVIYDLDIKYFYDLNNNGVGNIKGLIEKIDYFSYLNIDAVLFQNTLSTESQDKIQDFKKVDSIIGNEKDLYSAVKKLKELGIKTFIEVKIDSILKENEWYQRNKKLGIDSDLTQIFHPINKRTQEIKLNWNSDVVLKEFVSIVKFWNDVGIDGFVLKDFEFIGSNFDKEIMSEKTLMNLKKFYTSIKRINDDIFIIGKSKIINSEQAITFSSGKIKIFDYFIMSQSNLLGTHKKYGNDLIGKFGSKLLYKLIKNMSTKPSNIISLGNELSGRINTRWAKSRQYPKEVAKSIALFHLMSPSSGMIYYSDEIGAKNIGLTHLDDFDDETLQLRKRIMGDWGISEKKFMEAQVHQNPINSRSLMLWDNSKNAGFTKSNKPITPVSKSYSYTNVKLQFLDSDSILSFYKKVIDFIQDSKFKKIIQKGFFKIENYWLNLGVIKYSYTQNDKKIILLVNFSDKKKLIINKYINMEVYLSTYSQEKYDMPITKLRSYESIILISKNILNKSKEKTHSIKNKK